jgi:flagellin-like protein
MKANQSFRNNEEAVSPVIGVILMVAITVILAVVVFALVSKLSQQDSNSKPKVNVSSEDANGAGGQFTVLSIANNPNGGMAWANISFTGSASCTKTNVGSGTTSSLQGANVIAGDIIGCTANGSWNMIYTSTGSTGIVVAKGSFPSS